MTDLATGWTSVGSAAGRRRGNDRADEVPHFMFVLTGTSGELGEQYLLSRIAWTGSGLQPSRGRLDSGDNGLAVYLESIRSTLRLSVSDLARLFGVSRPTIYDWQKGGQSTERHAARVRTLAQALEPHGRFLTQQSGRIAQRAIAGRSTLLDVLADGTDPDSAVASLVGILEAEQAQREKLARRLEGKAAMRGNADVNTLG